MNADEIKKALRAEQTRAPAAMRPAPEFWGDFRARAAELPDDAGEVALPPMTRAAFGKRLAWVASPALAAAALLVAAVWSGRGGSAVASDAVRSYRVGEDVVHGGIMILNDEPSHATILWIVDLAEHA